MNDIVFTSSVSAAWGYFLRPWSYPRDVTLTF